MRIVGISFGNPDSVNTYSGVPFHLFNELNRRKMLVGKINSDQKELNDLFYGIVDFKGTISNRSLRRNKYWRYLPSNIQKLSKRLQKLQSKLPSHDTVIQFGVAGLPLPNTVRVAHVEISVEMAASSPIFSATYGFAKNSEQHIVKAIEGERFFLNQFDVVWTSTTWTARGFVQEGIHPDRIWVHPPACNISDPGPITRQWEKPRILFIGKVWEDKGGPLLLEAFRHLKSKMPSASLTIIGCQPRIKDDGVSVLGFLDKKNIEQAKILRKAYEEATIFCMPSYWESVGVVYMEAALYGLPVVMLKGQGREEVFPKDIGVHLEDPHPTLLSQVLLELSDNPFKMYAMGREARRYILENYTWSIVANRLIKKIEETKLCQLLQNGKTAK
ncbi:glycosyltransferase [Candidatus Parcubacteria bacterium]|nr:MAG: glycosyltransferase [Candidatus Parcubacteria bacterium]